MTQQPLRTVVRHLRKLAGGPPDAATSDRELLGRFADRGDEAAFASLMRRHGPMVRELCLRLLEQEADADDAFQATFLVLVRRARSIRKRQSLASWLYGVAYRVAEGAKRSATRRRGREQRRPERPPADPAQEAAWRELCTVLDAELSRLSEDYRAALVLCYLEGRTRDEAAKQLGWSLRTLDRRLERGRYLLRVRLTRRGLTLSTALLLIGLSQQAAPAAVPALLATSTIKAAITFAAGKAVVAGGVSAHVAELAEGILHGMIWTKMRVVSALVVLASMAVAGAGVLAKQAVVPKRPDAKPEDKPTPAVRAVGQRGASVQKQTRTDRYGDPLPEGAVARLGTSRLRTTRHWRFAPDSRRVALGRADGGMQIFEIPSGKPLALIRASDVPGRTDIIGSTIAFTRDGKYLAAVCWEGRCGIWETATGRLVRWLESGGFYSIVQCDFSPDGKLLAVGGSTASQTDDAITVGVYEVESGRRLFRTAGTNSVFASDGQSLVTWEGYHNALSTARRVAVPTGRELAKFSYSERFPDFTPRSDGTWFFEVLPDGTVRAWDVAAGKVKHTFRGPGGSEDVPVYVRHIPGRRELIAVGTKPAGMWCWDLETGKELWQGRLAAPAYYPQLSGDGKTLVTGDTAGTVRIWDAATGKERVSFRPAGIGHGTYILQVSPDGKMVATNSGGNFSTALAIWDAVTGKLLSDLPGHPSGILAAAFAPDGATVYTVGQDRTLRAWDVVTGNELSRAPAEPSAYLAVSSDGKTLFAVGQDGRSVRVLDASTGRVERQFLAFKNALVGLAVTTDGKQLVTAGRERESGDDCLVRVYDAGTGAELREFGESEAKIEQLAVRPDGGAMATTHLGRRIVLWDASGKKVMEQVGRGNRTSSRAMFGRKAVQGKDETPYLVGSVGLSADGRWLAYSDQEQGVAIVNIRTGREAGRAKLDAYYQNPSVRGELRDVLAFSPDGKTVAWSGVESTADVFLIEVSTAQVRRRLSGDSSPVRHLAFSPDGSKLLSAGPDGAALIWDVLAKNQSGQPVHLSASELEGRWADLAGADAAKAYQAICKLAACRQAAPFLGDRLRPVTLADLQRIPRLISELDSDRFASRDKAMAKLEKLGELAEPALEKMLRDQPSLEVRRRVERLLEGLKRPIPPGQRLQTLRAVEVLERIGTPEAQEVLRKLATGAAEARETKDAREALERLSKRPTATP